MDKSLFIRVAPTYYVLAVHQYFERHSSLTLEALKAAFVLRDDEDGVAYDLLEKDVILKLAMKRLENFGVITVEHDYFGPDIYEFSRDAGAMFALMLEGDEIYRRFSKALNQEIWLFNALSKLNRMYDQLKIEEADFDIPDRDWEPLPIDPASPDVQKAILAINATIDAVRSNNEYTVNVPQERNYVLSALTAAVDKLRDGEALSAAYLNVYVFPAIDRLIERFRGAAISGLATTARIALGELIKHLLSKIF